MVDRLTLTIVLQSLALLFIRPACEASSLGLTVHVEPLEKDGGHTVRAYFTAIASNPCPPLTGVCTEGVNCTLYKSHAPVSGSIPTPGWCVRQWQKVVPSNYNGTLTLNSTTSFYVSMHAGPHVRANSGKLNHPAFVALPPPLRAHANCPHHFPLSVKDLDGDKVRCRFAMEERGECVNCTPHSFIELYEDACKLTFTGDAPAGHYSIYLMAEDYVPTPKISQKGKSQPLSSVPVHLSLTVEEASPSCTDEVLATGKTPREHYTFSVLPFEEVKFEVEFMSQTQSVSEIDVVGQPGLIKYDFNSTGAMSHMSVSWVRSENNLTNVLPVCFVANTMSLQSEPRCVWLYQREMKTLPAGTELMCNKTEMILVLPVASLSNINLAELQLNSPSCPVTYNDTHLNARISLDGCGTKTVHTGTELVYTNTLKSVRPFSMISRHPSLILPLACRIPGVQAIGPNFNITVPTTVFDNDGIWIEFHLPGEGPQSRFTSNPVFRPVGLIPGRLRREAAPEHHIHSRQAAVGSRLEKLDLHLFTNTTLKRVEMIIKSCLASETEDMADSDVILQEGCSASNTTLEIATGQSNTSIFRIFLPSLKTQGSTMHVQCVVQLCVPLLPSDTCSTGCASTRAKRATGNSITKTFTTNSGPISLVVTTPAPTVIPASVTSQQTAAATTSAVVAVTASAPKQASSMALGLILATTGIFLQHIFIR
ncbi:uncharacterized protein LOC129179125 [Dunckerocampus dactyliophorus]|uniref:uncharacterized protein LOC129179125 n=1 Tax=Dunckerocampus dactyliophorus TaxID=161453 RepID=UPI0024076449|nr:uncharacterized protein LOC129179125 [Dunckerocampus dactyliophorus]XP_054627958.1 uncharacterized protein LOC129179125 [Dunckerocampus dactyliophorus]